MNDGQRRQFPRGSRCWPSSSAPPCWCWSVCRWSSSCSGREPPWPGWCRTRPYGRLITGFCFGTTGAPHRRFPRWVRESGAAHQPRRHSGVLADGQAAFRDGPWLCLGTVSRGGSWMSPAAGLGRDGAKRGIRCAHSGGGIFYRHRLHLGRRSPLLPWSPVCVCFSGFAESVPLLPPCSLSSTRSWFVLNLRFPAPAPIPRAASGPR